jgi:hypothetical protein
MESSPKAKRQHEDAKKKPTDATKSKGEPRSRDEYEQRDEAATDLDAAWEWRQTEPGLDHRRADHDKNEKSDADPELFSAVWCRKRAERTRCWH